MENAGTALLNGSATRGSGYSFRRAVTQRLLQLSTIHLKDEDFVKSVRQLDSRNFAVDHENIRQLQIDIRTDALWTNGTVIREFSEFASHLETIQTLLNRLNSLYSQRETSVLEKLSGVQQLSEKYKTLEDQKAEALRKLEYLQFCRENFFLSEEDVYHLVSSDIVDQRFYSILEKAQTISNNCTSLFAINAEETNEAATKVMKAMSQYIDEAFEKLFRYVKTELNDMETSRNLEFHPDLKSAFAALFAKPEMLNKTLDLIVQARQRVLYVAFVMALETGDPNTFSRPIELSAPDPKRFVNDIIAWLHQTIAGEKELIETLFQARRKKINESENSWWDSLESLEMNSKMLMDENLYGVCKAIVSRVQTSILETEDLITIYGLIEIFGFYRELLSSTIHEHSTVLTSLKTLEDFAFKRLQSLIDDELYHVKASALNIPADLLPPQFVIRFMKSLASILNVRKNSYSSQFVDVNELVATLESTVSSLFEISDRCSKRLLPHKRYIFLLNVVDCCYSYIEPYSGTESLQKLLNDKQAKLADELTLQLHTEFCSQSSLIDLSFCFQSGDESFIEEALEKVNWSKIRNEFGSFLVTTFADATTDLLLLTSPTVQTNVQANSVQLFFNDVTKVKNCLEKFSKSSEFPFSLNELQIALGIENTA
ncbi:hypothetical protein SJAG_03158 [Schizosaccharomyces japonicus yFS275]|uniref:Conserved oligomeric Golgi complex subunit 6 n=1 Tax=Schizosaccharomyces japonicus (strain yFS275 / FY16936) TaxID=402676 RepID=B6K3H4_SCHJY|nr:hypothetical protein SJAG_03158 [Schizosaccharomyces japonicus yFS275]EEB08031.1 hypothetical protein SJAG_03158 [Schizosaccharomyces japonicus yFS275]